MSTDVNLYITGYICHCLCLFFRLSNTSINAPNGGLAPVTETEENEITDVQNIGNPELDPQAPGVGDEGYVPGQAVATQEGMEGKVILAFT